MWPEDDAPRRYEWQIGAIIVPPNMGLRQHFDTGTTGHFVLPTCELNVGCYGSFGDDGRPQAVARHSMQMSSGCRKRANCSPLDEAAANDDAKHQELQGQRHDLGADGHH